MTKERLTISFFLLCLVAIVLLWSLSSAVFPITTDSVIYATAADQIRSGNGLLYENIFVQPPNPNFLPLRLHPPGYPLMVCVANFFGIDAFSSAVLIPRICFVLLPLAFFLVFRKIVSASLALVMSFCSTFMFPVMKSSLMAWSDVPFLFLSLISLSLMFAAIERQGRNKYLFSFLAGAVGGFSLLVRFVGYALTLSILAGLVVCIIVKMFSFKDFVKVAGVYVIGFLISFLPYAIRNIVVFGTFQPYKLPPSHISLSKNISDYLREMASMIFTGPHFDKFIILLILVMLAFFIFKIKDMVRASQTGFVCAVVLVLYFLSGSALLIITKTVYFGPEEINDRYLLQYAWVMMAGLIALIHYGLQKIHSHHKIDFKAMTTFLVLAFLLIQVFPAVDFLVYQKNVRKLANTISAYSDLIETVPEDHIIITNVPDMAYYSYRRHVRMLNGYPPFVLAKIFESQSRFAVLLIKLEEPIVSQSYTHPAEWIHHQGYRTVYSDQNVDLLLPDPSSGN